MGGFKGGALVMILDSNGQPSLVANPCAKDVRRNAVWIRPFVRKFKSKATSGFFAADVFLEADLADIAVLCDIGNPRDGASEGRCAR